MFKRAVNMYMKVVYVDAGVEGVDEEHPWEVVLTGDGARVNQRNKCITTCGVKKCDKRLPSQLRTGKQSNSFSSQSRMEYTPAISGYESEASVMPYFHLLVAAFEEIETRRYVEVQDANGMYEKCTVHLKVFVLQFLHEGPKEKKRKTTSNESEEVSNCYDSASELPE